MPAAALATLLLVLAMLAGGSVHAQSDDAMALAQHALSLQQVGDYAGAVEAYRAFLKVKPDDVVAHSNLGVALAKLGRYDEAIQEYEAADHILPGDPRIGLNLAIAYSKSGRVSEAALKLEKVYSVQPENQQVTLLLADCHLRLGDDARVIELLQPLWKATPDDLSVAYMLGTALIRQQRIAEGQVMLDRILKNGDSAESRFLLGMQMFESGDYPAAVKQLASAAQLTPDLPELQSYYGRALLMTGDADGAAAAFRKELANDPNDYAANVGLGQILTVRKMFSEALPLLQQSLLLRPQALEARLAMGEYLIATGKLAEARQPLEEAVKAAPNSLAGHEMLATVYTGLKMPAQASQEQAQVQRLNAQRSSMAAGSSAGKAGPKINDPAPRFSLPEAASGKNVSLSDFKGKSPVVLVFGSYSCPNFRSAADALKALYAKYGKQTPFLLVYIREAHSGDGWESTRNTREGVSIQQASTIPEKQEHATMCTGKLRLPFPAVVDGLDGAVENAYNAWPSLALVVGTDGRVLYTTRLTELEFHANELEAALQQAVASR
ncbi:MAG: tetratricopeptide repeat protein [Bryobacteraceae bacterium]